MMNQFQKRLATFMGSALILISLSFGATYIYITPGNSVSIFLFKIGYQITPDLRTFLQVYSPVNREVNSGTLPVEVDDFLCNMAAGTDDPAEVTAIADLYVTQAGGREGGCIFLLDDQTNQIIAGHLIERLIRNDIQSKNAIILLEEIRLEESLGKGNIGTGPLETEIPSTREEWDKWMKNVGLPTARQKYIEWWNIRESWQNKRMRNPLDGTKVRVKYCCG